MTVKISPLPYFPGLHNAMHGWTAPLLNSVKYVSDTLKCWLVPFKTILGNIEFRGSFSHGPSD